MTDFKVTVVLDFTVEGPEGVEVDEDELHDAIVDAFDTVDLEDDYKGIIYDDDDEDTGETQTFHFNCDRVEVTEIEKREDA